MGEIVKPTPVLLLIAVSSRHDAALAWAEARAVKQFGPLALESEAFDFTETDYYASTMGSDLKKQFFTFERLIDPAELASIKCLTNEWELNYAGVGGHEEPRPLNLDPGYLTLAKLVLGLDQGPRPSDLSGGRHPCGADAAVPRRRLAALPVDLSRLPPGRLSEVFLSLSRGAASPRPCRIAWTAN